MSDPISDDTLPALDLWCDDQLAVMDAASSTKAAVVIAGNAPLGFLLAATHPERVSAVVAIDNLACMLAHDDYPLGWPRSLVDASVAAVEQSWGSPEFPLFADVSDATRDWLARYRRQVCSPGTAVTRYRYLPEIDIRHLLGAVRVPTLLVAHRDVPPHGPAPSYFMAERMCDTRVVELPGKPFWFWAYPDPDAVADEVEEFVTGTRTEMPIDRVLTTVAFTDVVASTRRAAELGDRRWLSTVEDFQKLTQAETDRFGGRIVKWTGDGHLATFDAPGRAIRWACQLRGAVSRLDLDIRAGIHTGEIELRGDDIGGMAVVIGRRICDSGGAREVLVSASVPPLVAGSGFEFEDRGSHVLQGVPGEWRLFEVG